MIIAVPAPSSPNIIGATHRELIRFDGVYPIDVAPAGGRLSGRVPFAVILLLYFRSFAGLPMWLLIEDNGKE